MEKSIIIDGLRINYDESGRQTDSPVILMHGYGCEHTTVASIAAALNGERRVYSIDLPGHGKSDEPPVPWGVNEYTDLIEKFCRELKIIHPVLIGHSFGGRISIMMGSRDDISKIVLIDAAGIKPRRSLKYYLKVYSFKTAKKLLPLVLGRKAGNRIVDRWRNRTGSSDYVRSSPMMRAVMTRCVNQDLKKYMPSIKAPTLLIWGENDTATPLRDAKTMEKLIPDAGLVVFPGCGHFSFLDNPTQFRAVIRNFVLS